MALFKRGNPPLLWNRRRRIGAALGASGLLAVVAAGWFVATHRTIEIVISAQEIQRRIDERLPVVGKRGPVAYEVQTAQAAPQGDGRIGIASTFTLDAAGRDGQGVVVGSGRLSYQDGSFYLRDFQAETLRLDRLDAPDREPGRVRQALGKLGNTLVQRAGLEDEIRELVQASRETVAQKSRDLIVSGIRGRLESHPVYRLQTNNIRHEIAKLALKEVRTESGQLVVVLDPLTAIGRVLLYAAITLGGLLAALGFAVVLARSGGSWPLGLVALLPD